MGLGLPVLARHAEPTADEQRAIRSTSKQPRHRHPSNPTNISRNMSARHCSHKSCSSTSMITLMLPEIRDPVVIIALSIRQGRRVSPERSKHSAPNPLQKYTPNVGQFSQRTKIFRLGLKHQLTCDFRKTFDARDFRLSPDKLGNETGLEGPSKREFVHLSGLLVKKEGSPLNLWLLS